MTDQPPHDASWNETGLAELSLRAIPYREKNLMLSPSSDGAASVVVQHAVIVALQLAFLVEVR